MVLLASMGRTACIRWRPQRPFVSVLSIVVKCVSILVSLREISPRQTGRPAGISPRHLQRLAAVFTLYLQMCALFYYFTYAPGRYTHVDEIMKSWIIIGVTTALKSPRRSRPSRSEVLPGSSFPVWKYCWMRFHVHLSSSSSSSSVPRFGGRRSGD